MSRSLRAAGRPGPTPEGDEHARSMQYFSGIQGAYFTGDGARRDEEGYFHVVGRIDDVLNVSGHRIGTAGIESSLVAHPAVAEAAAVSRPDDIKGQAPVVFVTLKPGNTQDDTMKRSLTEHVRQNIGKFARPDEMCFADSLPRTRSGKIMRRLLKDVAAGRAAQGDLPHPPSPSPSHTERKPKSGMKAPHLPPTNRTNVPST